MNSMETTTNMKTLVILGWAIVTSALAFIVYGAYMIHPGLGIMAAGILVLLITAIIVAALTD